LESLLSIRQKKSTPEIIHRIPLQKISSQPAIVEIDEPKRCIIIQGVSHLQFFDIKKRKTFVFF
jgi:hypothetical protein